jgi:hypothetical protein
MTTQAMMTPAEVRQYMKAHYAFGLPAGSVRALLALTIFGGIWAWMYRRPDAEVPAYLRDLMFIVMGHYFAARRKAESADVGPPPLYLPRGSVRTLLLAGCATVAGALVWQHRMLAHDAGEAAARLSHAGVTLILVAGFMLGVVAAHLSRNGVPRWLEDLRAAVSLAAGAALLLLAFDLVHVPAGGRLHDVQRWLLQYRVEDVLAAVVGFYFGSRS